MCVCARMRCQTPATNEYTWIHDGLQVEQMTDVSNADSHLSSNILIVSRCFYLLKICCTFKFYSLIMIERLLINMNNSVCRKWKKYSWVHWEEQHRVSAMEQKEKWVICLPIKAAREPEGRAAEGELEEEDSFWHSVISSSRSTNRTDRTHTQNTSADPCRKKQIDQVRMVWQFTQLLKHQT